jgi:uncharacterized protein YndB with AHSA1/START domain
MRLSPRLFRVACGFLMLALPGGEAGEMASQKDIVSVTKTGDREVVVAGTFEVPRQVMFEAITQPEPLKQWMSAGGMSLAEVHVDARPGGGFRYVFQRASGSRIEVRGAFRTFDPPRGFAYLESYDFSPLEIEVTTKLDEVSGGTRFTQNLRYVSTRERDEDFDAVATSSREAYARLARYLETEGRSPDDGAMGSRYKTPWSPNPRFDGSRCPCPGPTSTPRTTAGPRGGPSLGCSRG